MSDIINLILLNNNVFVWSAKDWLKLRRNHRIVGELTGCLAKYPRQDILSGLPLLLMPEEVSLLIEKEIAQVVECPCIRNAPTESLKEAFQEYRDKLLEEQEHCFRNQRKKQVIAIMDKIVEGKRRKVLGINTCKKKMKKPLAEKDREALQNIEINRDELLEEEMAKIPKLEENDALVQTHTVFPWYGKDDIKIVDWKYPSGPYHELRYKTYKDLWEKGFYVTTAEKFGGDFLVYPGDPIMFHSQFIVSCNDRDKEMSVVELIAQFRLGCHVKKTQVFSVLSDDKNTVKYHSFQWAESSILENG